jgi:glycosyltransferase involved in cell wall biosynthesis
MTLRVLLLSPLPGIDPPSGDVVYTDALLRNPPPDVEYEDYATAMSAGRLLELGRRADYRRSSGVERVRAFGRIGRERTINALRESGMLFREPFRFFRVETEAYDLVHCHVFSVRFVGKTPPLVFSNACLIEDLYRHARGWSDSHVRLAAWADSALARSLGVQHTSYSMPEASSVVCFTSFLTTLLARHDAVEPSRLHVAPCFVEQGPRRTAPSVPRRVGFIATDFAAKGGNTVLEAFDVVRRVRPDAELFIVGSPPRLSADQLQRRQITWLPRVPRDELLTRYLSELDVLAYPTEFDGLPLTVLEALARGIPVATSDYQAMPEVVGQGIAGSVTPVRDAPALAESILRLLEPEENVAARTRAAEWFDAQYAPAVALEKLRDAYHAGLASPRSTRAPK